MQTVNVVKIGGNIIDEPADLNRFLKDFASLHGPKILIHGGGKLATRMAETLGIPQQMVDGRRITDAATLRVVTMVYAGSVNKEIVALLQAAGCNAMGLSGADGGLILSHKRMHPDIDYGYVGDVDRVNTILLKSLLSVTDTLVIAPVTHDGNGQLLNCNADTIAQEVAQALTAVYQVQLIYCYEKEGVLGDVADEHSVIPLLRRSLFNELTASGAIHSGMLPKLQNAFTGLDAGIRNIRIGKAAQLIQLINGTSGTIITHEP